MRILEISDAMAQITISESAHEAHLLHNQIIYQFHVIVIVRI